VSVQLAHEQWHHTTILSSVFFVSAQLMHAWWRHTTEGSNHVTCVFCDACSSCSM
jgi:hypothetical protein